MKGLREKFRKHEGFTLVEMLIVVAIIAILVAVSIPLVNTSLEKARKATDDANLRTAKAEATIMYMDDQIENRAEADKTIKTGYVYDIAKGEFVSTYTGDAYNRTTVKDKDGNEITGGANVAIIKVTISTTSDTDPITVAWEKKS